MNFFYEICESKKYFMFLNSLNYFRAIAIIFIVFGHSFWLADFEFITVFSKTIINLTAGGTFFFVFISGFLFHHIFYKKFNSKKFFKSKFKYVVLPYLFMSVLPIANYIIKNGYTLENSFYYLKPIGYCLVTGTHLLAYWYIPFIILVFALSFLYVRFIKLDIKYQLLIFCFLSVISVFLHRPPEHSIYLSLQSLIYFTPFYLFGIICSEKKEMLYSKLFGKEFVILSIGLLFAILQVFIGVVGNYHKPPFEFASLDLMFVHKLIFSVFFMIFLHRFETVKSTFLDLVAKNSFGIFFIHGYYILIFLLVKSRLNFSFPKNSFLVYVLVAIVIFVLSLLTSMLIRKVIPKYSRSIIGS